MAYFCMVECCGQNLDQEINLFTVPLIAILKKKYSVYLILFLLMTLLCNTVLLCYQGIKQKAKRMLALGPLTLAATPAMSPLPPETPECVPSPWRVKVKGRSRSLSLFPWPLSLGLEGLSHSRPEYT